MKFRSLGLVSIAALSLTACGEKEAAAPTVDAEAAEVLLANGQTAAVTIDARQKSLKGMGGAFKTIGDQLKSGAPDAGAIQAAALKLETLSQDIGNWFPEGSDAASGVDTDALDAIWSDPEGFATAIANFQAAAVSINAAAQAGDMAAVGAATRPLGMSCKGCHDTYRADDD